jgi:hypothetical protein
MRVTENHKKILAYGRRRSKDFEEKLMEIDKKLRSWKERFWNYARICKTVSGISSTQKSKTDKKKRLSGI